MTLRVLSLLFLSCSLTAQIYSNGPLVTDPIGGFAGGPVSILQAQTPAGAPPGLSHTVFGYGAQQVNGNSLADDFATNGTWVVSSIEVFGYLTGAAAPTATDVRLQIYMGGSPATTGVPLVDGGGNSLPGMGVNLFGLPAAAGTTVGVTAVTNVMTGIFRALDTTPLASNRNIQSIKVDFAPALVLPSGIYWLRVQYGGINFCPPVTTNCVNSTGDAIQNIASGATWATLLNGTGGVGMPFVLYGTSGSPPGAFTNLGGGCDTATIVVDGSPAVGGYVRAQLGNLNPLKLPLIAVDFTTSGGSSWPGCSCLLHFTPGFVPFWQPHVVIPIPMNLGYVGLNLWVQGGQIDFASLGPCPVGGGVNFGLTDGYRVQLY